MKREELIAHIRKEFSSWEQFREAMRGRAGLHGWSATRGQSILILSCAVADGTIVESDVFQPTPELVSAVRAAAPREELIAHIRKEFSSWAAFANTMKLGHLYLGWHAFNVPGGIQLACGSGQSVIVESDVFPAPERHPHADMIIAKVNDMSLVVLKRVPDLEWGEVAVSGVVCRTDRDYFLCHPKHTDAVLHVLNGGEAEACIGNEWGPCDAGDEWSGDPSMWYLRSDVESRIKQLKDGCWYLVQAKNIDTSYVGVYRKGSARFDLSSNMELSQSYVLESDVRVISEMVGV